MLLNATPRLTAFSLATHPQICPDSYQKSSYLNKCETEQMKLKPVLAVQIIGRDQPVILVTPPSVAAAPTIAYRPGVTHVCPPLHISANIPYDR